MERDQNKRKAGLDIGKDELTALGLGFFCLRVLGHKLQA
jgi:hypothetical protein